MLHSAGVGGSVNKQGRLILDSHFVSPLNLLTEIKEACGITLDMRVGIVFNVIEDKFFLIYCWMQFTVYLGKLSHGGWCWDSLHFVLLSSPCR